MKRNTLVFVVMFLVIYLVPLSLWANPFINEFHYDNAGVDTGEAIEIAGSAGTDLAGYNLLLYNGTDGTVYTTTPLSGVIPDLQNGFGTLFFSYASGGIQNDGINPDGLALIGPPPLNMTIQFLSYGGGTFTAVDGAASGMTSTDIGVSEDFTTPVGYSLQLAGVGTSYADFSWSTAAPNTFGGVNNGQVFTPIPPSLLLLGSGLLGLGAMGWRRRRMQ
jgi:hypothetical protein